MLDWEFPEELKNSKVLKDAIKLAKHMISTRHCAKIMLLYNCDEVKTPEGLKLTFILKIE